MLFSTFISILVLTDTTYCHTSILRFGVSVQDYLLTERAMNNKCETIQPERRVVTLNEAAVLLRISRASAYQGAKTKEIPTIRIGRRLLVPLAALERLLSGNTAA
jgi:excisionase family DNA binding protein